MDGDLARTQSIRELAFERFDAARDGFGMTQSEFGLAAVNDTSFFSRLRSKAVGVTLKTIERVEAYIERETIRRRELDEGEAA